MSPETKERLSLYPKVLEFSQRRLYLFANADIIYPVTFDQKN